MDTEKKVRRFTSNEDAVITSIFNLHLDDKGVDFCVDSLFNIFLGIHSKRAIKDRWSNFLSMDSAEFTDEDDKLIQSLHKNLGNKWSKISKYFKNRSPTQVRIRYYQMQRKENRIRQSEETRNTDSNFFFNNEISDFEFFNFEQGTIC